MVRRVTTENIQADFIPKSLYTPLAVADHLYDEAQVASRETTIESVEDQKDAEINAETDEQNHEISVSVSHLLHSILSTSNETLKLFNFR